MIPAIYFGGGTFKVQSPYHRARCDKLYGEGQEIMLDEVGEDRNMTAHRHYFARLKDLWQTLPEWLADDFASPNHFRKWLLCKTGHCDKRQLTFKSNEEAIEWAAFMQQLDTYLIIEVTGRVLTVWKAHSQSIPAMKNKLFMQSKQDVLTAAERLIALPKPR